MFIYEGTICPYCKKELRSDDIITVCPECGTPHHRECYMEHGECANAARHAEGFEWAADKVTINRRTVTCPRCGRENAEDGKFCNYCGFEYGSKESEERRSLLGGLQQDYGEMLFRNEEGELEDIPPEEKIDGIAARDWATYIGSSANYYLYYFKSQIETGKKAAFTLSAAVFPTIYFCYRKIWWLAGLAALAEVILAIPTALSEYIIPMGVLPISLSAASLETAASVCSVVLLALHMLYGLFAVYLYRQNAKKQILRIQSESVNDVDFREKLKRSGGPSIIAVQIIMGVLFFLTTIATFLLMPLN